MKPVDNKQILLKIKKCFALGKSPEPHEATQAIKQAKKLMEKYKISINDIEMSDIGEVGTLAGKLRSLPRYQHFLINVVKEAFNCEAVLETDVIIMDGWVNIVKFIGINPDPQIASYTYEVLLKQLITARKHYIAGLRKNLKKQTKTRRGDLFAEAWVGSIAEKLTVSKNPNKRIKTLINKWMANNYPDMREASARKPKFLGRGDSDALHSGAESGRHAKINQGVEKSERRAIEI